MSQVKRLCAAKTRIITALQGMFVKENGEIPNHVLLPNGTRMTRINILATIVQADITSGYPALILDDGTGKIMARAFEQTPLLETYTVGTIVMVIGRIREFSKERYLIPEAIKKITDPLWTVVRAKELEQEKIHEPPNTSVIHSVSTSSPLVKIIKTLDSGEGADEEQVIAESGMLNAEQELQHLMHQGLLFSPKPGRIKVLE